jgi:hypothetical protein
MKNIHFQPLWVATTSFTAEIFATSKRRSVFRNKKFDLLLCIGAAAGGAMINVGTVAGKLVADYATKNGAREVSRTNAIWLPLLFDHGYCSGAMAWPEGSL